MGRRSFLAMLASAPIAALAPLPKILEQRLHDPHVGIAIRFIKQWDAEDLISVFNDAFIFAADVTELDIRNLDQLKSV